MRISDWSSDVCSSDLSRFRGRLCTFQAMRIAAKRWQLRRIRLALPQNRHYLIAQGLPVLVGFVQGPALPGLAFNSLIKEFKPCVSSFLLLPLSALLSASPLARKPLKKPPKLQRSEEHTSELQSLMRISYAVFCLKKTNNKTSHTESHTHEQTSINNQQY